MQIILAAVNAKYIHTCLALYSLRDYAAEYRPQITVCEYTINQPQDDIIADLFRKKPDFLAFSCYIWNISQVLELSEVIHQVSPRTVIWLGGPEVSWESEKLLAAHPFLTGIMQGEGEKIFRMLLAWYCEGKGSLPQIPGIVYYDENGAIRSGRARRREDLVDMDELPFVYEQLSPFENRIIYYEASRGCPFSCSYCLSSVDKGVRWRSLSLVKKELQFFLDRKVPQVKFTDRTFNCSREYAIEIWRYILEHDNGVTNFHFEIEANLLTDDELELIGRMRPGLIQMEIGVQSTNEETLRSVHRNPDFSAIRRYAQAIGRAGNVHLHLDLIAGLPYEDYETFRRSFRMVYELGPDELQLGFLKLLKGSGLYREAEEYGFIWHRKPPYEILSTRWMSYGDILRLKGVEEMLEVYYNSRQFTGTIALLEKCFHDPMALYERLAAWYETHGLSGLSHTRMRRLDILRDFAHDTDPAHRDAYDRELLTDLYRRERAKARPAWAPENPWARERAKDFCRKEEREHALLPHYASYSAKQLAGMIHLEYFPENEAGEAYWLLFDYGRRSPLSQNAQILRLEAERL